MVLLPVVEAEILRYYHVDKCRNGTIARRVGRAHGTVDGFISQAGLKRNGKERPSLIDAYLPFITQTLDRFPALPATRLYEIVKQRGYTGGSRQFRRQITCRRPQFDAFEWMLSVLQNKIAPKDIKYQLADVTGSMISLDILLDRLYTGRLSDRNKTMVILASKRGLSTKTICSFLGISPHTYKRYKLLFENGGSQALFLPRQRTLRMNDDESLKTLIFKVLHEPPSNYGINRTTWTMPLLRKILYKNGKGACREVIRSITWAAGYRWRKARIVLTSTDPSYTEKLDRIHFILAGLQSDEVFFSIDEYGPFAVKLYGGRKLVAPGEQSVVPQWQKSHGSLVMIAALELGSNQLTHFFSNEKNTGEMIKMMDVLVTKYADRRKIYLSWDAASWHISNQLNQRIDEHNDNAAIRGGVVVETAPLPAGAQFLNVIESVFSGMSRAIIHSSDYQSLEAAKAAINQYIEDRNNHFQKNPQRAGKKIWGEERELSTFSDSNNCKDPRYR